MRPDPGALLEATYDQVEEWTIARKYNGGTAYCALSILSGFYQWAVRTELTDNDPTQRVIRPKILQHAPRPIPSTDLDEAIRQADPEMKLWLVLAAYQGLRCKEIAGLRTDDLLIDRDPPMMIVSSPKGNRERLLPLNPAVVTALRSFGGPSRLPATGPIFKTTQHRPVTPGVVSRKISLYLHYIGIDATAHQLRHWFATEVYSASRDLRMTQQL